MTYDASNNPLTITDVRPASEWPAGASPVSRVMTYDDAFRVTRVDFKYGSGSNIDVQTSPFATEDASNSAVPVPRRDLPSRPQWQTFAYDWQGNTTATDDDAHAIYDRSLGGVANDPSHPHQLRSATGANGALTASYDATGNLANLVVTRQGRCTDIRDGNDARWPWLTSARGDGRFVPRIEAAHGTHSLDAGIRRPRRRRN